jgi:WD40 repeat protein
MLLSGPAMAAGPYDPALTYRSVGSPHFAVHYPPGAYNLAVRVSRIAERVLVKDADLFGFMPEGQIEVVLTDTSDDANGSAQVMPKNTVRLFLAAPTELTGLSSYDDWLEILLTHEIAHIVDIDQTHGWTRFLRYPFGKYIQWNGYTPQFLSEGVAVYAETKLTPTGRGRSSYVEMILRTAALDDRFLQIDQAHVLFPDWPGGNAAYFYGGRFHLYLSDRFGDRAVRDLHQYYASQLVPYIFYFGAESVFDQSLPSLWDDFRRHELAYAQEVRAGVEAAGATASRRLTHHGRNISGSRYTPDGSHIIYSRSSPVDGPTVRMVDRNGENDHFLRLDTLSPRFGFERTGQSFYYSMACITCRFDAYNDLYRYDLATDRATRLRSRDRGRPLRGRDPTVSPDGTTLAFVQNDMHQSWLSIAKIVGDEGDELAVQPLVGPVDDVQHASPTFSPDGKLIAESVWLAGGHRDILVVDALSGRTVRRVTHDRALDGNPAWSPDGRYILYESDADGISNLYAYELERARYYRITHVVGGAFQPDVSPDASHLLFRNASGIGFDIHEMPYDPNAWEPQDYDPERGYTPVPDAPQRLFAWSAEGPPPSVPRADEAPLTLEGAETESAYAPLHTLLPFQDNWVLLPTLIFYNRDPSLSLTTLGRDPLGYHTWVLSGGSSWFTRHPNWALSYANDRWYPTFSVSASDQASLYYSAAGRFVERNRVGNLGVSIPWRNRHAFSVDYTWDRRSIGPRQADYASLGVGYSYAFAHAFPYSVSLEHGRSFSVYAKWYRPELGGDYRDLLLSMDARAFLNNPLFDNNVLALRMNTIYAVGPDRPETFFLYGTQGNSFLSAQSGRLFPLRGFFPGQGPFGAPEYSSGIVAAYMEYRFPVWRIERGLWDLPFYARALHAAFFVDAGNGFGRQLVAGRVQQVSLWQGLRQVWGSFGAEVRLTVASGWAFPLTVRGGVGVPAVVRGQPVLDRTQPLFYVDLGTAI